MKISKLDIRNLKAQIHHIEQAMFDAIGDRAKMNELKKDWKECKIKLAEWTA